MARDPNHGKSVFQRAGEKYSRDLAPEWVGIFGKVCAVIFVVGFATGSGTLILCVWLPLTLIWFVIWLSTS